MSRPGLVDLETVTVIRFSSLGDCVLLCPLIEALDAADAAWVEGRLDIAMMEDLIGRMLTHQLSGFQVALGE